MGGEREQRRACAVTKGVRKVREGGVKGVEHVDRGKQGRGRKILGLLDARRQGKGLTLCCLR